MNWLRRIVLIIMVILFVKVKVIFVLLMEISFWCKVLKLGGGNWLTRKLCLFWMLFFFLLSCLFDFFLLFNLVVVLLVELNGGWLKLIFLRVLFVKLWIIMGRWVIGFVIFCLVCFCLLCFIFFCFFLGLEVLGLILDVFLGVLLCWWFCVFELLLMLVLWFFL